MKFLCLLMIIIIIIIILIIVVHCDNTLSHCDVQ